MRELNNLMADSIQKIGQKEHLIYIKYRESLDNAIGMEWKAIQKKYEKDLSDAAHEGVKSILDFEKSQPDKPIFIFKANHRYYKLKIDWVTTEYTKLKKPIPSIRLLRRQKPGWIVEYTFSKAFDFATCPNCQREFTRTYPHEKYCYDCRRSPRSKRPLSIQTTVRNCQNPGCEKPIPTGKNKRTKYCCNACKTAAYEKRKLWLFPLLILESEHPSSNIVLIRIREGRFIYCLHRL